MTVCPNCGNQAQDTAIFCDQCGTRLKEPETPPTTAEETAEGAVPAGGVQCTSCGFTNVPGELFCENCGAALEALEPEPATPVASAAEAPAPAGPEAQVVGTAGTPDAGAATPAQETAPAAPPEAEQSPAPADVVETPATAGRACPACGAPVGPEDEYCDNCGAALKQVDVTPLEPATQPPEAAAPPAQEVTTPRPCLIVVDTGAEIPLPPSTEILIGREDPVSGVFPDIDLTPHGGEEGGVSRKHLQLRRQDGSYVVEDLNSTNFTLLNQKRLAPHAPHPVKDGDELRLGRVRLRLKIG